MKSRVSNRGFVGRGEELDRLAAALASAKANGATTVLVAGDAGVGKTRLVEEFCRLAEAGDPRPLVASGVCVPIEGGGLPYGAVFGIMRSVARQLDDAEAARILGPLADGLNTKPEPTATQPGKRQRAADELAKAHLFETILTFVTRLAARSPVVLVFDDLQWADSASAELLNFLTRNLGDAPVLLLGTYRREELGPEHELGAWLAELGCHGRVTTLQLRGLDRDDLTTLITGILGHRPDWALVEAVWARSEGNPFFAEELTAAGPAASLPSELARVIITRVERLSKKAQHVLRVLAVGGPDVDHRLVAAVVDGFDADALDAALAEVVDNQVVVVDEARTGYRFRHALLREAVYHSLLPGELARLHHRVAEAVAADPSIGPAGPGHRAAMLAVHWWEAGEWAGAYAASREAADAASAVWAFPEAFAHLERALAALGRMPGDAQPTNAERLRLLDQAADVAYLGGAAERSVELAEAAIEATDADADPAGIGRRHAMLGRNSWALGDSDLAFAAYRRAIELMPLDPPSPELAQVLAEEARGLMLLSLLTESEGKCRVAIAVARAVGARAEEGHALNTLGCARGLLGHTDEGVDLLRQALAIAQDIGIPDDIDRAYTNLSAILLDGGRLEEAAALVSEALGPGDRIGFLRLSGAAGNSAQALIRLGRYDEAGALIAQMGDRGVGICASAPQLVRLPLVIRRGRFEEAAVLLTGADERTAKLADVQTRGNFHIQAAELALWQDRPDDAFEEVERALALAAGTDDESYTPEMCALGVRALADRLEAAHARGRRVDADKLRMLARSLVEEIERLLAASIVRGGRPAARVVAFRSWCAAEESRLHSSDGQLWQEAADAWQTVGEPYPVAYCRWRQAEARLANRSARNLAVGPLQEAWRISVQLGAPPLQERIEGLARRARIALSDDPAQTDGDSTLASDLGLTPREAEVLGQLAAGRTDKEIADALFISKKTASVHVSNLLRKLDVSNRVEAGRIGQARGLG